MGEVIQKISKTPLRGGSIPLPETTKEMIKNEVEKANTDTNKKLNSLTVQLAEKVDKSVTDKIIKKISISSTKESIRTKNELEKLIETCKQENSKKFDFMVFLIEQIKNIDYLSIF